MTDDTINQLQIQNFTIYLSLLYVICNMKDFILFSFFIACMPFSDKMEQSSDNAPQAIGPYSQAIQVGNHLYLSGQIAINPLNQTLIDSTIEGQTKQIFTNIKEILRSADFDFKDIVQTTVYLKSLSHYSQFNTIYASYFEKPYPARAVVEVSALPRSALVEISVIAIK